MKDSTNKAKSSNFKQNSFYKAHNTPFLQLMIKTIESNDNIESMTLMQRHMRDVIDILKIADAVEEEKQLCVIVLTKYFAKTTKLDSENTRHTLSLNELIEYLLDDKNQSIFQILKKFDSSNNNTILLEFITSLLSCQPQFVTKIGSIIDLDMIASNFAEFQKYPQILDQNINLLEIIILNCDNQVLSNISNMQTYLSNTFQNLSFCSEPKQELFLSVCQTVLNKSTLTTEAKTLFFSIPNVQSLIFYFKSSKISSNTKLKLHELVLSIFKPSPIGIVEPSARYPFESSKNFHAHNLLSSFSIDTFKSLYLGDLLENSPELFFESLKRISNKLNMKKTSSLRSYIDYFIKYVPSASFLDQSMPYTKPSDIGTLINMSIPSKWSLSQFQTISNDLSSEDSLIVSYISLLLLKIIKSISSYLYLKSQSLFLSYVNGSLKRIIPLSKLILYSENDLKLSLHVLSTYGSIIQLNASSFHSHLYDLTADSIYKLLSLVIRSNDDLNYLNLFRYINICLNNIPEILINSDIPIDQQRILFESIISKYISTNNPELELMAFNTFLSVISISYPIESQLIIWISNLKSLSYSKEFSTYISQLFIIFFTSNVITSSWKTVEGIMDDYSFCINTRTLIIALNHLLSAYDCIDIPSLIFYTLTSLSTHLFCHQTISFVLLDDLLILFHKFYSLTSQTCSDNLFAAFSLIQLYGVIKEISNTLKYTPNKLEELKILIMDLKDHTCKHRYYIKQNTNETNNIVKLSFIAFNTKLIDKTDDIHAACNGMRLSYDDILYFQFLLDIRRISDHHFNKKLFRSIWLELLKSLIDQNTRVSRISLILLFTQSNSFKYNQISSTIRQILDSNKNYFDDQITVTLCSTVLLHTFKTIDPLWIELVMNFSKIITNSPHFTSITPIISKFLIDTPINEISQNIIFFNPFIEYCTKKGDAHFIDNFLNSINLDHASCKLAVIIWHWILSSRPQSLYYYSLQYFKSIENILQNSSYLDTSLIEQFSNILTQIYKVSPLILFLICKHYESSVSRHSNSSKITQTIPFIFYFHQFSDFNFSTQVSSQMTNLPDISNHFKSIIKNYQCLLPSIGFHICECDNPKLLKSFIKTLVLNINLNEEIYKSLDFLITNLDSDTLEYILTHIETSSSLKSFELALKCSQHLMIEDIFDDKRYNNLIKRFFEINDENHSPELIQSFNNFLIDLLDTKPNVKIPTKSIIKLTYSMLNTKNDDYGKLMQTICKKLPLIKAIKYIKFISVTLIPYLLQNQSTSSKVFYLSSFIAIIFDSHSNSEEFFNELGVNNSELILSYFLSHYSLTLSFKDTSIVKIFYILSNCRFYENLCVYKGSMPRVHYQFTHAHYNSLKNGTSQRKLCYSCLKELNIDIIKNTITLFDVERSYPATYSKAISKTDSDNIYDPYFLLCMISHVLDSNNVTKDFLLFLCQFSLLGLVIVSLSSLDDDFRKLSYSILTKFNSSLKLSNFHCKFQLQIFMEFIKNSIETVNQPLLKINALILANISTIIIDPSHTLYSIISQLLSKYSYFDHTQIIFYKEYIHGFSKTFSSLEIINFSVIFIDSVSNSLNSLNDLKLIISLNLVQYILTQSSISQRYEILKQCLRRFILTILRSSNFSQIRQKTNFQLIVSDIFKYYANDTYVLTQLCQTYIDDYYVTTTLIFYDYLIISLILSFLNQSDNISQINIEYIDKLVSIVAQDIFTIGKTQYLKEVYEFLSNSLRVIKDPRIVSYSNISIIYLQFLNKPDVKLFNKYFYNIHDFFACYLDHIMTPILISLLETIDQFLGNTEFQINSSKILNLISHIFSIHFQCFHKMVNEEDEQIMDCLKICLKILRTIILSVLMNENVSTESSTITINKEHILNNLSKDNFSNFIQSNPFILHEIILSLL